MAEVSDGKGPLNRRQSLMLAQQVDKSLKKCVVVAQKSFDDDRSRYVLLDGVLLRKWFLESDGEEEWNTVLQFVVPKQYHQHILSLPHDNPMSAHLEVTKNL